MPLASSRERMVQAGNFSKLAQMREQAFFNDAMTFCLVSCTESS